MYRSAACLLALALLSCDAAPDRAYPEGGLWPDAGPATGGTLVTIRGDGFREDAAVVFGAWLCTDVTWLSEQELQVVAPAGRTGPVDVQVMHGVNAHLVLRQAYTFEPGGEPRIHTVSPGEGPTAGGTPIALVGEGFTAGSIVLVGAAAAGDVEIVGEGILRATTPPGPEGRVDVRVIVPERGPAVAEGAFRYHDPELVVDRVAPDSGPARGGNPVMLTGTGFTPRTRVRFGDRDAGAVTWIDETSLQLTPPASLPGAVAVTLTDPARPPLSLDAAYTYEAEGELYVERLEPAAASVGTPVRLHGAGFTEQTAVRFGARPAMWVDVESSVALVAVVPPHTELGPVDLTVESPGLEPLHLSGVFEYVEPPQGGVGGPDDPDRPVLLGAVAVYSDEVLVRFDRAMGFNSVSDKTHYAIAGDRTDASWLPVTSVTPDGRSVTLKTGRQSAMTYTLVVVGASSAEGQPLAAPDPLVVYNVATFQGKPEHGSPHDSDEDGLSDADELAGRILFVTGADGETTALAVGSDHQSPDSDNDGLNDRDEIWNGTHPRRKDTDNDGVSDYDEANRYYSDPADVDTDDDGLQDGLEITFHRTSAILEDTDGDQYSDYSEIVERLRPPRIADLPAPVLSPGEIGLSLDIRTEHTDEEGRAQNVTSTAETSVSNSDVRSHSSTDSGSGTWFVHGGVKVGYESGVTPKWSGEVSVEGGYDRTHSWQTDNSDAHESARAYNSAVSTATDVDSRSTITKSVEGARVVVAVTLSADSDVAFTLSNLELSVLHRDAEDNTRMVPVATLVPFDEDLEVTLGPGLPPRGPVLFESVDAFPSKVEELMRRPHGIAVKWANYDVTDEDGRNLAFTRQEVAERTGTLVLDLGQPRTERYQLAFASEWDPAAEGRKLLGLRVTDALEAIGLIRKDDIGPDDPDYLNSYALASAGAQHADGSEVLELTRIRDAKLTPAADLPAVVNERTGALAGTGLLPGNKKREKFVIFEAQVDRDQPQYGDVSKMFFKPGHSYTLAYSEDWDGDGLWARMETHLGSSDRKLDTDGDGLLDPVEVFGMLCKVWAGERCDPIRIRPSHRPLGYRVLTRPDAKDSDGDGLTDAQELLRRLEESGDSRGFSMPNTDEHGVPKPVRAGQDDILHAFEGDTWAPTDPTAADTDQDGLDDWQEAWGWSSCEAPVARRPPNAHLGSAGPHWLRSASQDRLGRVRAAGEAFCNSVGATSYFSDPLHADEDYDGLIDGVEARHGRNPRHADRSELDDDDGDGLTEAEERNGYSIQVCRQAGACDLQDNGVAVQVTTSEAQRDTDDDGLDDLLERRLGTDASRADTDGDGLSDLDEWKGLNLPAAVAQECRAARACRIPDADAGRGLRTDPLHADTDRDGALDGDEVDTGWTVELTGPGGGEAGVARLRHVRSDPLQRDTDQDGLWDGVERDAGTHPRDVDSDGDGVSDYVELGTYFGGAHRDPLRADQLLETWFSQWGVQTRRADLYEVWNIGFRLLYEGADLPDLVFDSYSFRDNGTLLGAYVGEDFRGLDVVSSNDERCHAVRDTSGDGGTWNFVSRDWNTQRRIIPQGSHVIVHGYVERLRTNAAGNICTHLGLWHFGEPGDASEVSITARPGETQHALLSNPGTGFHTIIDAASGGIGPGAHVVASFRVLGSPPSPGIRLVDGGAPWEGNPEAWVDGRWKPVVGVLEDIQNKAGSLLAHACAILGFGGTLWTLEANRPQVDGWLYDRCEQGALSLANCHGQSGRGHRFTLQCQRPGQ